VKKFLLIFLISVFSSSAVAYDEFCKTYEWDIERDIEAGSDCKNNEDCTNIWPGSTFGCFRPVNVRFAESIMEKVESYINSCGDSEMFCIQGAPAPVCYEGKCAVR